MEALIQFDHWLFFAINNGMARKWLDPVFDGFSSLGGFTMAFIAFAFLAHLGARRLKRHIVFLVIGALLTGGVSSVIKKTVRRARPLRAFEQQIAAEKCEVRVIGKRLKSKSFPSGHSLTAFFFMTYIALWQPAYRFWVLLLAFLSSLARVYVGAHFPIDCLVGSLMGALGAWLTWRAHQHYDEEAPCSP